MSVSRADTNRVLASIGAALAPDPFAGPQLPDDEIDNYFDWSVGPAADDREFIREVQPYQPLGGDHDPLDYDALDRYRDAHPDIREFSHLTNCTVDSASESIIQSVNAGITTMAAAYRSWIADLYESNAAYFGPKPAPSNDFRQRFTVWWDFDVEDDDIWPPEDGSEALNIPGAWIQLDPGVAAPDACSCPTCTVGSADE